jgi:P-type Ca2+ transporter type 2C
MTGSGLSATALGEVTPVTAVEIDGREPPSGRPSSAARASGSDGGLEFKDLVGLSADDARARLQQDGPNELAAQKKRNLLSIVFEVVREPMFLMLVAAGVVYLLLGELADASMLLGFVFVVMSITIVQARRTEHALEALRDLSSPRALVIRDGQRQRIAGREVVAGDLVVLAEGDRIAADGLLRQALHLSTDESLLTGESVPVRKMPSGEPQGLDRPGGDDLPSVFSGTLVTSGQGVVEITATGPRTELGKIGKALEQTKAESTMLQTETRRIVRLRLLKRLADLTELGAGARGRDFDDPLA